MSHQFFDFEVLEKGTKNMVELIKKVYPTGKLEESVVQPVEPGFIRNKLPEYPPKNGSTLEDVINETGQILAPGFMHWQSPKFFGYFPCNLAVTSVIAELFAVTFQTPGFNYSINPTQTELENVVVDWITYSLGLPEKFLFKNSGGAILNWSATETIFVSVHAAKRRKMAEIKAIQNPEKIVRFVGYYSQFSFVGNQRGLRLKQIFHTRAVPTYYCEKVKNFVVNLQQFEKIIQKDVQNGLIPFWYGATYGSTFSGAIDISPELIKICKKYAMWINVDAAYLGTSFMCAEMRPDMNLFKEVDSFITNFSKAMLVGIPGTVLFVADKDQFVSTFESDLSFTFFKNKYSAQKNVVDYKDWGFGLARRFNSLKFFFLMRHYGLERLQNFVRSTVYKRQKAQQQIQQSGIFKIFSKPQFGLVCFQLCDHSGLPNNLLTKQLGEKIKNIPEGFMSPGDFKEYTILRLPIGNNNATQQIIHRYIHKIIEAGQQILNKNKNQ